MVGALDDHQTGGQIHPQRQGCRCHEDSEAASERKSREGVDMSATTERLDGVFAAPAFAYQSNIVMRCALSVKNSCVGRHSSSVPLLLKLRII